MKRALESLAQVPGVQSAMATTEDGVPIASAGRSPIAGGAESESDEALAALTMGWVNELRIATGLLSWDAPARVVLRCARGSIVLRRMRGAVLMTVLGRGANPEDVRIAMDAAAARIERSAHQRPRDAADAGGRALPSIDHPPGALPGTPASSQGASATEIPFATQRRDDPSEN